MPPEFNTERIHSFSCWLVNTPALKTLDNKPIEPRDSFTFPQKDTCNRFDESVLKKQLDFLLMQS